MLWGEFLRSVLFGAIISLPQGYSLINYWLKQFPEKLESGFGIFLRQGIDWLQHRQFISDRVMERGSEKEKKLTKDFYASQDVSVLDPLQ